MEHDGDTTSSDFPGDPPEAFGVDAPFPAVPGYDLIDEIARGGMGVVYEALQQSTGRRVAIKIILAGTAHRKTGRRRFEREIDLIARLAHPDIVSIIDSGIADGLPFYAMDFVEGKPLDEAFMRSQTGVRTVLGMIVRIARAVDYAHQRGVIHRDLKPSNILLDNRDEPKLLDFGLAKAFDPFDNNAQRPSISEDGSLIGTLAYMAPEQTTGNTDDISLRIDIYALGAIAYELLTGTVACSADGPLLVAVEGIRNVIPAAPSSHRHGIARDIDAIVLKCLEKDPARRYPTAGELADDIDRWLSDIPIRARRTSPVRRARQWCRRHRAASVVIIAAIILIVGGATGLSIHLRLDRIDAASDLRRYIDAASASTRGEAANAERAQSRLDELLSDIETRLGRYPSMEATARHFAAEAYLDWRSWDKALHEAKFALHLNESLFSRNHPSLADSAHLYARTLYWTGDFDGAAAVYRRVLAVRQTTLGPDDAQTILTRSHLAASVQGAGHLIEAESVHRAVLDARQRTLGESHNQTAWAMNNLASCLIARGLYEDARQLLVAAIEAIDSARERKPIHRARFLHNLARAEMYLAQLGQAREDFALALQIKQDSYKLKKNDDTAHTIAALAELDLIDGNFADALSRIDKALGMYTETYPGVHRRIGAALIIRGRIQWARDEPDNTLATFAHARDILIETVGRGHQLAAEAECLRLIALIESEPNGDLEGLTSMPLDDLLRDRTVRHEAARRIIEYAAKLCKKRTRMDLAVELHKRLTGDDVDPT